MFLGALLSSWGVALQVLAWGLRTYPALTLITVYEAFLVISGNLCGLLVMHEAHGMSASQLVGFGCSTCLIVVGLAAVLVWPTSLLGDGDIPVPYPCARPSRTLRSGKGESGVLLHPSRNVENPARSGMRV